MSPLPFELFLALRYLRPKRTFVSVITLISVIGVTLGVAVLIIVISVMTGFDQQLREKILGFNAHMRVVRRDATMANYPLLINVLSTNREIRGVTPFVLGRVLLKTQPDLGNSMVDAPWVRGVEPTLETNVSVLHTNIVAGEFNLEGQSILIGNELARSLHLRVGDRVLVYSPHTLEEIAAKNGKQNEVAHLPDEYTVRGIFDVGYYEYNASVVVTSLENAQDLYRLDNTVHGLLVMLHDPFKVETVRRQLSTLLGKNYRVSSWTEENSGLLNALLVEKNVMFYLLFFIMIVAAFGIMNSLITFVVQKTREIGMLKAVGATRGQIVWLFLSQGLVVGIVGVITGYALGMLALKFRNEFLGVMNDWTGLELFPASIYSFAELPALTYPKDIILICGSALVTCVLAALIPAWIAGGLKPVEALRHE